MSEELEINKLRRFYIEPANSSPCVYFLFKGDDIVYVGQTRSSVYGRIGSHLKDKDFDSFAYYEYDQGQLNDKEASFICSFNPVYNKNLPQTKYLIAHTIISKRVLMKLFDSGIKPAYIAKNGAKYFHLNHVQSMSD